MWSLSKFKRQASNSPKDLLASTTVFLYKSFLLLYKHAFAEMIIIKPPVLFLTFVAVTRTLQNSLISAPFDNFRIECAKSTGI